MKDKKLERQAYLDGQLTVEEALEFEAELTPKEKADLEAEKHFETVLGERLSDGTKCPEPLWNKLKTQMLSESGLDATQLLGAAAVNEPAPEPKPALPAVSRLDWRSIGLAAMVLINIALLAVVIRDRRATGRSPVVPSEFVFTSDMDVFARDAVIPGDYDKMRSGLTQAGFHLSLAARPPRPTAHVIQPLGLRLCRVDGEQIARIYFDCCGYPMLVLVMPKTRNVTLDDLPLSNLDGFQIASKTIDNYRIVVVGQHSPKEILSLFS